METNKCDLLIEPLAFLLRYLLKKYIFLNILDVLQSTIKEYTYPLQKNSGGQNGDNFQNTFIKIT